MKCIAEYILTLPKWTICPLVNGDLCDNVEDEAKIAALETELDKLVAEVSGTHWSIGDISDKAYFACDNDIDNVGGNVYDVTFHIFK